MKSGVQCGLLHFMDMSGTCEVDRFSYFCHKTITRISCITCDVTVHVGGSWVEIAGGIF